MSAYRSQQNWNKHKAIHLGVLLLFVVSLLSVPFALSSSGNSFTSPTNADDAFANLDSRFFCSTAQGNSKAADQDHKDCTHCPLCTHVHNWDKPLNLQLSFFHTPLQAPTITLMAQEITCNQITPVSRGPPSQV